MNNIQKMLQPQSERLLYLDIKKPLVLNEKTYEDLTLPIIREDFVEEIQEGNFDEEIRFEFFIRGMVFNISIDPDFVYNNIYKEILKASIDDLENYLFTYGLMEMEYGEDALHFFRTNYILHSAMVLNSYYYVVMLEKLKKGSLLKETETARRWLLEEIIELDPDFPLSYYRLGLYAIEEEKYSEAFAHLKRSGELLLNADKYLLPKEYQEEIMSDISIKLEELSSDAQLKRAVEHLEKGEFYESLDLLNDLNIRLSSAIVKYYLGFTYRNLQELDLAIELYEESMEAGFKGLELFQDLSFSYYEKGNIAKSREILEKGLEIYKENEKLLYNRAAININMGKLDEALEDLETIISYDDISDDMFNEAMILRENIMKYKEETDDLQ